MPPAKALRLEDLVEYHEGSIVSRTLAKAGETVLMPANVPHAVHASKRFKMLLLMVREVQTVTSPRSRPPELSR